MQKQYYNWILICLFILSVLNLAGQITEEIDPTVSQFEIVSGDNGPGFTGDLDFSIPLMTVPGRGGLDYNINLIYVMGNGVPASESASWVGLGWNLNSYQITCSPSYASYSWDQQTMWTDCNDLYYMTYPNGSTPIFQFEDKWRPLKWSATQIVSDPDPSVYESVWKIRKDFKKFTFTDIDGTKYIFAERLRQDSARRLRNHCHEDHNTDHNDHNLRHPYYYTYKLTAILSPDYIDENENNQPDDADSGNWIKLTYTDPELIQTDPELSSGDAYRMEISYLDSIITPTHIALFGMNGPQRKLIYQGMQVGTTPASNVTGSLSGISLVTREGENVKSVKFNTAREFSWAKRYAYNNYMYELIAEDGDDYLRLKLNSIEFFGESGSKPTYTFQYNDGPPETITTCYTDSWGLFSMDMEGGFLHQEALVDSGYWMLEKVTYPTGGSVEYKFEADRFQYPAPEENYPGPGDYYDDGKIFGGGVRIKSKTIYEPQSNQSNVYTYTYAHTNYLYPDFGFIGIMPMMSRKYNNQIIKNSIGANATRSVHYPDIEITRPDGSIIRQYFSCGFSGVKSGYTPQPGDPLDRYTPFLKSAENILVQEDADLRNLCLNNSSHPAFDFFTNSSFKHFSTDEPYYDPNDPPPFPNFPFEKVALIGEASEFDDMVCNKPYLTSTTVYYYQMYDNTWKQGYLTREENINSDNEIVQEKLYKYQMIPIKSEYFTYNIGLTDATPSFITSGWARMTGVETHDYDLNTGNYAKKEIEYSYNEINGLVERTTETNYDYSSDRKFIQTGFAFEEGEDPHNANPTGPIRSYFVSRNMLSQVAWTSVHDYPAWGFIDNTLVKLDRTCWTNYHSKDSRQYYPDKDESWIDKDDNDNLDTGEWQNTLSYLDYDAFGNIIETETPNGTITSYCYGHASARPIAKVENSNYDECTCIDFEDSDKHGWYLPDNWANQCRDDSEGHSGIFSWKISGHSTQYYISKTFTASTLDPNGVYVFSAWVKSTSPNVQIDLKYNYSGGQHGHVVYHSGSGEWELLETECDLSAYGETLTNMAAIVRNLDVGVNAFFDDLRVHPKDALMTTQVWDPWNPGFNQIITKSDVNNIPIYYMYDGLGRLKKVINTDGAILNEYEYYYSADHNNGVYHAGDPNFIRQVTLPGYTNQIEKYSYYDGLGRIIQNQTVFGDSNIVDQTIYNNIGKVWKQYKPQKLSTGVTYDGYYDITGTSYPYEILTYQDDALARPDKVIHFDGTPSPLDNDFIQYTYGTDGAGMLGSMHPTVLVRDEKGKTSKKYFDIYDNELKTTSGGISESITWSQEFNLIGNPVQIDPPNYYDPPAGSSSSNFDTNIDYNTLGQMVGSKNPDMAQTIGSTGYSIRYYYDNMGNLKFSQDAIQHSKSTFTAYNYDLYNRVTCIGEEKSTTWDYACSHPSGSYGTDGLEWKIKYDYDQDFTNATKNYSHGRLTRTQMNDDDDINVDHTMNYVYDKFGNKIREQIIIDEGSTISEKVVRHEYDMLGRENVVYYPSGNEIRYSYNGIGSIEKINKPLDRDFEILECIEENVHDDGVIGGEYSFDFTVESWIGRKVTIAKIDFELFFEGVDPNPISFITESNLGQNDGYSFNFTIYSDHVHISIVGDSIGLNMKEGISLEQYKWFKLFRLNWISTDVYRGITYRHFTPILNSDGFLYFDNYQNVPSGDYGNWDGVHFVYLNYIRFDYIICDDPIINFWFQSKVFLEGAYKDTTNSMDLSLNQNSFIPLISPYSEAPDTVNLIPANVVDWVLIQLRSNPEGPAIYSKSAFLRNDGFVMDIDSSDVVFENISNLPYYVVIKHRNHLPVMSADAYISAECDGPSWIDFTLYSDKYYSGKAKLLRTNPYPVYGMISGDANSNGIIQNDDKNDVWLIQSGSAGYLNADFTMDGHVDSSDKDMFWIENTGYKSGMPNPSE